MLASVRKQIGYIFQAHNLLEALTARQNVEVALQLNPELDGDEIEHRAAEVLGAVGLGDRLSAHPSELSGGERQRVAIARSLAAKPELLLADEPTASLDRKTGRNLVELLQRLAKKEGVTVVLVTHDNRILDIADRILSLEDGRLASLMRSVASETHHVMALLADDLRKGDLAERLSGMPRDRFANFLEQVTEETRELLEIADLVQGDAFGSVEQQVVEALNLKLCDIFQAQQAILFFVDPDNEMLFFCGSGPGATLREPQVSAVTGIVGHVLRTGQSLAASDASQLPQFDPRIDGADTSSMMTTPVRDYKGEVFAVIQLRNKLNRVGFGDEDQRELAEIATSLGFLLESWWRMGCGCRRGAVGRAMECCPPIYRAQ